ncbi:MAG: hypothetical protein ACJ76H_04425 [Bacteriovoracaceae bacterium]
MKLIIALTLFTTFAFADSSAYRPRKMTCAELRDALESYKVITVRYGFFDISRYALYESSREARQMCGPDQVVIEGSFRTLDSRDCRVGSVCGNIGRR